MTLAERATAILTHLESLMTLVPKQEFENIEAAFHAEFSKLEAAALAKIAQVKNAASKI